MSVHGWKQPSVTPKPKKQRKNSVCLGTYLPGNADAMHPGTLSGTHASSGPKGPKGMPTDRVTMTLVPLQFVPTRNHLSDEETKSSMEKKT